MQTKAKYLLTDSRQLTSASESIFFAIKGPHHDGHIFINDLYQKGVREFVVQEFVELPNDAQVHIVENTITALQEIAKNHRKKFSFPMITITGSNGKTIVKEWLYTLLSPDFEIVKSPKSYNSQIGVPLSVWQINDFHTLGIFEAGISTIDEMAKSEAVIQPTFGIFTNLGTAHDEGFENKIQKLNEKLRLFKNVKYLIFEDNDHELTQNIKNYLAQNNPKCEQIAWKNIPVKHHFKDAASIQNLGHCVAMMQVLGVDLIEIQTRVLNLKPISMRLELKEGINGCYIIDDSYNNDLGGLKIGLDFLQTQNQRKHKILILSDLLQTGISEEELYPQIAKLIDNKGINQVIGIGEVICRNQKYFKPPAKFYESTEAFLAKIRKSDFLQSVILVKGARKFELEKVVNKLTQKSHSTELHINLDAISNNLNYFKSKLEPNTKIMVMVKAFAYGSGSAEVANLLQFHRIDYLAVAYTDEGVYLRENGIKTPIMVMNASDATFEKLIENNLEPEIYSHSQLDDFLAFLAQQNQRVNCHIKLDTGMKRLGFESHEIDDLLKKLNQNKNLKVMSVFSHLAGADDTLLDDFTSFQLKTFQENSEKLEKSLGYKFIKHLSNSAGIARFQKAHLDMVRLGIGLYGVANSENDQLNLWPVGTLKTEISQIKHIAKGETVGYGRKGVALKETKTATIAIGYADGFDRRFSNGVGKVLINNNLCSVIGNVCMDMTMIDITDVEAKVGDEVIVFGENPSIKQLAMWANTISYEILTGVNERVKRVFYSM